MRPFVLNGELWRVVPVRPGDERLTDRTGTERVATTDPSTRCVYLSRSLSGPFLETVLLHEIGHCALYSYGLLESLHRIVPRESWEDAEEWACNFLADHGRDVLHAARVAMGAPVARRRGCEGFRCSI